jgi:ABC-type transport system involved in multi-copper enzyme maturation permease subunit
MVRFRPPLPELPLLRKELVGLLRTKRAFWLLAATVAGSALLSLFVWPSSASSVADSEQAVAAAGAFLLAQLTAALFIVPAFAAGAISGERERGTYDLLLASRLSPASIVASKGLASAGYIVILLLASLPGIILLHLLGGVTFGSILRCEAVTLAAVILSTFICLLASIRAERTSRAVTGAVLGVAFWNGGLSFLLLVAASILRSQGVTFLDGVGPWLAAALSPHATIALEVLGEPSFLGAQGAIPQGSWMAYTATAAVLSFFYLVRILLRAGTPGVALPWRADRASGRARPFQRRSRARPFLTRIILEMSEDKAIVGNPVFRKEICTEFFGRVGYRRLVFWGLCAVFASVMLGTVGFNEAKTEITTIASLGSLLVILLAPAVAASAFPREIEQGNLDALRGTLMSPWDVLRGKFFAALYATFGVVAAAGWGIGLAAWAGPWQVQGNRPADHALLSTAVLPIGVLVTTWVFVTAVATCASVLTKRTLAALVGSYAVLATWFLTIHFFSSGLGILPGSLSVATEPFSAIGGALSGDEGGALLGFFLFYAALTLAIWHVSRLEVEMLRGRDE